MSMSMSMFDFVGRLGIGSTFCSLFLSFFFFKKKLFETQLCVLCVVLALINLLIFFCQKEKKSKLFIF